VLLLWIAVGAGPRRDRGGTPPSSSCRNRERPPCRSRSPQIRTPSPRQPQQS